jgi:hypothetical protein
MLNAAGGDASRLSKEAQDSVLFQLARYSRIAAFLESPELTKTYLQQHCQSHVIDTTRAPWSSNSSVGMWQVKWSPNTAPGLTRACVNLTYADEFFACAPCKH